MSDTKRKPPAAGKGRPKGSRNKTTAAIKDMLLQALDEAHSEGAVAYLKQQAAQNPVAFMTLQHWWKGALERAGLPDMRWHELRAST